VRKKGFLAEWTSGRMLRTALRVVAIGVCFLPSGVTGVLPVEDPHAHFQNPEFCPSCHLRVDGKPVPDRFVAEADAFCLECHRTEDPVRSHPRNVRPKDKNRTMKVPEEFRLNDEGEIMCLTCHRGHGESRSAVRAFPGQDPEESVPPGDPRRYRTYYVRRSDPVRGFAPLCGGCHPSR